MIESLLALCSFTASAAIAPSPQAAPGLTIDPCVQVDEATVTSLVEIELALYDGDTNAVDRSASVSVRCVDGDQRVLIETGGAEPEAARTIELAPISDTLSAAAREARMRELALAIAEVIRRGRIPDRRMAESEASPPTPLPSPPPAPATVATSAARAEAPSPRPWRLGLVTTFDYFSDGQRLVGGDLALARSLATWFFAEARVGARVGREQTLPTGRLTASALAAGAAAGVELWSPGRSVMGALALRAQAYRVQFRLEQPGAGSNPTARLGVVVLAAEPRAAIAIAPWLLVQVAVAVGAPVRGISVRTGGAASPSLSGVLFSGNLEAAFTF